MKNIKKGLIGIFVFIVPILFYLQAAQQEKSEQQSVAKYLDLYQRFIRDSILHHLLDSIKPAQAGATQPRNDEMKDVPKQLSDILVLLDKRLPATSVTSVKPSAPPQTPGVSKPDYSIPTLVDQENRFFDQRWRTICQLVASPRKDSIFPQKLKDDLYLIDLAIQQSFLTLSQLPEAGLYTITLSDLANEVHQWDLNNRQSDLYALRIICSQKFPIKTFQIRRQP